MPSNSDSALLTPLEQFPDRRRGGFQGMGNWGNKNSTPMRKMPLEAEGGSEVDKAIRIRAAAEGVIQGEALAELRPQGAHRRPEVGVIEYVVRFGAEV